MKILIDADACPVKEIVINIARQRNLKVTMVVDTSHILSSDYADIITVDKYQDSADYKILSLMDKGDIIVTQDYGLASMALGKLGYAINNNGYEYTNENIDRLLFERHINKKLRQINKRHGAIPKRTNEDNINFQNKFIALVDSILNNNMD